MISPFLLTAPLLKRDHCSCMPPNSGRIAFHNVLHRSHWLALVLIVLAFSANLIKFFSKYVSFSWLTATEALSWRGKGPCSLLPSHFHPLLSRIATTWAQSLHPANSRRPPESQSYRRWKWQSDKHDDTLQMGAPWSTLN